MKSILPLLQRSLFFNKTGDGENSITFRRFKRIELKPCYFQGKYIIWNKPLSKEELLCELRRFDLG